MQEIDEFVEDGTDGEAGQVFGEVAGIQGAILARLPLRGRAGFVAAEKVVAGGWWNLGFEGAIGSVVNLADAGAADGDGVADVAHHVHVVEGIEIGAAGQEREQKQVNGDDGFLPKADQHCASAFLRTRGWKHGAAVQTRKFTRKREKEASWTRRVLCRKECDTSRSSPRFPRQARD